MKALREITKHKRSKYIAKVLASDPHSLKGRKAINRAHGLARAYHPQWRTHLKELTGSDISYDGGIRGGDMDTTQEKPNILMRIRTNRLNQLKKRRVKTVRSQQADQYSLLQKAMRDSLV